MKAILLVIAVVFFFSASSQTVLACVCVSIPNPTAKQVRAQFADDFKRANVIFSGKVIRLDKFKVTFAVEKVWKGKAVKEITMSTGEKNNGDGTTTVTSCDYNFEADRKYLVYAAIAGTEMQTSDCTGTGQLEGSEERIKFLNEIKTKKKKPLKKVKSPLIKSH